MKLFRTIYFVGVVLIFVGGYRLVNHQTYGNSLFAAGVILYSTVQLILLFQQSTKNWALFEYLKFGVNFLFLISVGLLLFGNFAFWYYPFIVGLLMDFFANIFRRIQKS